MDNTKPTAISLRIDHPIKTIVAKHNVVVETFSLIDRHSQLLVYAPKSVNDI